MYEYVTIKINGVNYRLTAEYLGYIEEELHGRIAEGLSIEGYKISETELETDTPEIPYIVDQIIANLKKTT